MSKTVPRWVTFLKVGGGVVALVMFFWQGVPLLLQRSFAQAVADLAAPHEAKAAIEHERLAQMIRANGLEHERFVQRLTQDERQWSEYQKQWADFMQWYGKDSAEKERQLIDIQQGMRRLLEQQARHSLKGVQ